MRLTMTSWLVNGWPRQLVLIAANSRCSTRFHFDVPGGKWQTVIARLVWSASAASSAIALYTRGRDKPHARATIDTPPHIGRAACRAWYHQARIAATANAAVACS